MSSLYDLTKDFLQVQALIDEGGEGLQDTLESINLAIEDKLENIGKVIRNLEGEAEMLKNEESRLADKRKSIELNKQRLKTYVEDQLAITGMDKIKTGLFTFAIQNNAPSVKVVDDKLISKKYFIEVAPRLDKTAIKNAIKEGEIVPGAELVQSRSLRIR